MARATDGQFLPTETQTAAYNANNVVSVFMSLNRNDLLTPDEQGSTQGVSFLGEKDPFQLRDTLQKFDFTFDVESNSLGYKIKLLNPVPLLEGTLLEFYDKLYPTDVGTFEEFKDLAARQDKLRSVTGEADTSLLSTAGPPSLPRIYIRWGYGDSAEEGISSIHKCVLTNIKYTVNSAKDKELELSLVDTLTFTSKSSSFDKREHAATVSVWDYGNNKIKPPSVLISELLAEYASVWPEVSVVVDLYGTDNYYAEQIDNIFYKLCIGLAKEDKLQEVAEDAQGETSSEGLPPISADPDQEFTDGEKEELVRALGYVPSENIHSPGDNDLTGKITPQVINVAYKFLLNELGINYKQGIKLSDLEAESEPSELQTMVMSPIIDAPINEEEVNQRTTNSAEFLDSDIINLQGKGFEFKFYPRVYVPGKKLSFTNTRPMTAEEWTTHGPDGSNKATFVNLRPGILSDDLVNDFQFSINELNTKVFSTDKGMGLIEGEPMVFCRIPEDTPYVFDIEDQTMFHEGSGNDDEYLEITAPGTTTLRAVVADAMRQHEELHEDVPPMKIGDETVKAPSTNRTDKGSVEIRVGEHPTDFFATLNTATTPSIEAALMGLVNGLNKIVIGTTKKIWTFTIHQSLLSPLQREAFLDVLKQSPSTESLFDVETAVDNIKDTVLLITDDEAIDAKYGTFFTKAIYSFPEVTTSPSQGAQGENTEARAVWLRYGEADSIVTDITFKSDIRYLSQMAQANYTVRQYNDIKGLFDSKIKWEGVINYVVGEGLASKLADLKKKQSNFESEDETTPFDEEILKIENITKRTKVQSAEPADQQLQDGEVDSLVLDYFPNALKEMLVDVGVDQTILRVKDTSVSLESLQKIAAVVQDKEALEVFFPFADIDKATNIQTKHSYYVGDSGGLNVKVSENIVLARRINYDFTQSIGGDSWKKDLDTKLSYVMAMQRQAWEVDAVFLGIPEMDNPPVEMTQRRIYLVVKDERIPGAYHWLSGVYRVIKVSHSIDPSKGYLTKISLRKDVVLSSNFSSYIENGSVK